MKTHFLSLVLLTAVLPSNSFSKDETPLKSNAFEIAKDGKPSATIVIPEETEFDRYVRFTPEDIDALARKRFPNASTENLELVKKNLPAAMKKEAPRVGDE